MRRYETRSTIMTSNQPLEDWGKLIGGVPSATAILDRFLHHAEIITMNSRSYRRRNRTTSDLPVTSDPAAGPNPVIPPPATTFNRRQHVLVDQLR